MKLIYVVEDHDVIRSGVSQYLTLSGYQVESFADLASERQAVSEKLPDLIIQDVMLPDGDGFMYVRELKKSNPLIPVIFMTARTEESDRILGFELGCDDYITKPFSPKELVLRVQALFRRMYEGRGESDSSNDVQVFSCDGQQLIIDNARHQIFLGEEQIPLTAAEWKIISTLSQNAGNLVTRSQILEKCFDYSFESYERVVDTHIKNIRAKLKGAPWIDTVRGYGYRFAGKAER